MSLHVFNKERGPSWMTAQWSWSPTVLGRYLGTLLKGWWVLGRCRGLSNYFAVELAIGGENSMLQFGVILPYVGRFHIGVRIPRRWITSWIYERRVWGVRIGYLPGEIIELQFGHDSSADDMASYYRAKRKRGESMRWTRVALWPGLNPTLRFPLRLRRYLLQREARRA